MTGKEFEQIMREHGFTQTSLAKRWGMVRQTIANCCKADKVEPIYEDAMKAIVYERQIAELIKIVHLVEVKTD